MRAEREVTDPSVRAYWAHKLEQDMAVLKVEMEEVQAKFAEVASMKRWLAGSSLLIILALAGFALWVITRQDNGLERAITKAAEPAAAVREDLGAHIKDEAMHRDRMERKVDKLVDVIVEGKSRAQVRAEKD